MPYNNLTGTIPTPTHDGWIADLTGLKNAMETSNQAVNLTPEERGTLYKMGPTRQSLVLEAITRALANPGLVPGFISLTACRDDKQRHDQWVAIRAYAQAVVEIADDSAMASGSECLTKFVMPFYAALDAARKQNVPGADSAYNALAAYYDLPSQPDGGAPDPQP